MIKYNTISLDAADTLFFIKDGLGAAYSKILKNYTNQYNPEEISTTFKKHFSSKKGLHFTSLQGEDLFNAEKNWWYVLVKDIFLDLGMFKDFDQYFDDLYDYYNSLFNLDFYEVSKNIINDIQSKKLKDLDVLKKVDVYSVGSLVPLLLNAKP